MAVVTERDFEANRTGATMVMIAVLGVPRSGNSLIAGILHHLGYSLGSGELWPADKDWNPKGFFVDAQLAALHDGFIRKPFAPTHLVEERGTPWPELQRWRSHLLSKEEPWAINEWRLPFLWSNFLQLFPDTKIIRPVRPFHRCVKSWAARTRTSWWEAAEQLSRHLMMIEDIIDNTQPKPSRVLEVPFDQVIDYKALSVAEIASFAGRPFQTKAVEFIDRDLRRF
jgi:hypothetical protein